MGEIILTDEYVKAPMARSVPMAQWERGKRYWWVDSEELTPRGAIVALKLFPQLGIEYPEVNEIRDRAIQDVRPFDNATEFDRPITTVEVLASLHADEKDFYQFQSLDLGYIQAVLEEHHGAYIGWERGLGKTLGACAIIEAMDIQRALIVVPNTAKESVWRPEIEKWLPSRKDQIKVIPNQKVKREQFLARMLLNKDEPVIMIVHYEALDLIAKERANKRGWDRYGEWGIIIADEAHRIKNPTTKMARALKKIPTQNKLAMSGSIIQNHAEELFSPLQWMFPLRYKSKWRDFNDRFLDYVDGGFSKICVGVKLEALDDLRRELGVFMVYRRKRDEIDLPTRTDQTMYVELSQGQRKTYDELIATCLTELPDGTKIKAADGLVLLGKLRQIASGLDLVGDVTDSSKLDLAMELINDTPDEATVVFGWYKASIYALEERLVHSGIDAFVVTGDVKQDLRGERIARFQAGEGQVFLGTLATLGESVNLQRASNAIFLDRHWNPALNVQAEDRIYRLGQDKPVTITHIIAKDTVDEHRVLPTITTKEALRSLILGDS
jgi:SNF2 family DNA or RNA helicase